MIGGCSVNILYDMVWDRLIYKDFFYLAWFEMEINFLEVMDLDRSCILFAGRIFID